MFIYVVVHLISDYKCPIKIHKNEKILPSQCQGSSWVRHKSVII